MAATERDPRVAELTIRPMRPEDLSRVARLETDVYPQPWSLRVFQDELRARNRSYLVVEDDRGGLLGYGGLLVADADAHITTVAVDPSVRRRRLGTRLVLALVDEALNIGAEHLTLEVRMSNAAAQRLYATFGFAPVGLRKNYYQNEDALVMWAIDIRTEEYRERIEAIRRDVGGAFDG
jgi:ribosomal-protein-alanine N-acetyltransferase